jgi:hypothetical protein
LNLAAGQNVLLLNYEYFDKIHGYIICGFNQHIDHARRTCVKNEKDFYTLEFPDFTINNTATQRNLQERVTAPNANKTKII